MNNQHTKPRKTNTNQPSVPAPQKSKQTNKNTINTNKYHPPQKKKKKQTRRKKNMQKQLITNNENKKQLEVPKDQPPKLPVSGSASSNRASLLHTWEAPLGLLLVGGNRFAASVTGEHPLLERFALFFLKYFVPFGIWNV